MTSLIEHMCNILIRFFSPSSLLSPPFSRLSSLASLLSFLLSLLPFPLGFFPFLLISLFDVGGGWGGEGDFSIFHFGCC